RKGAPRTAHFIVEKAEANVPVDARVFEYPQGTIGREIVAGPDARPPSSGAPPAPPMAKVSFDEGVISGLDARNIGSATMSGRVSAVAAANVDGKTLVYVGAASGGVWKSQDGGTRFVPVFDKQPVQSIGAITIDPRDPRTVWVGTGETWTRNSVSVGDGIYKSTDAGETWTHMGLPESERIARIVVHPKNGEIVYACVTGKLWSDSRERGVYRTSDGGKTWKLVLSYSDNASTGCSSLTIDPKNPDVLFAGMWDFRRKGWTFRSGGDGPNATSGGAHGDWHDLWIDPQSPKHVIGGDDGGLWQSFDGGNHWWKQENLPISQFYHVAVDNADPYHVYGGLQDNSTWIGDTAYGRG